MVRRFYRAFPADLSAAMRSLSRHGRRGAAPVVWFGGGLAAERRRGRAIAVVAEDGPSERGIYRSPPISSSLVHVVGFVLRLMEPVVM